eukprot:TRINITY_DN8792_c0_g1_i1.p1 TRINITY_DN8792_c0_g1~~TRINITY_DN8792_c0_g1_i1.p1  ORF type:complete len:597 (+),score=191.69 TRINITY_DN8792_c0_g1_i1:115-1791(+)
MAGTPMGFLSFVEMPNEEQAQYLGHAESAPPKTKPRRGASFFNSGASATASTARLSHRSQSVDEHGFAAARGGSRGSPEMKGQSPPWAKAGSSPRRDVSRSISLPPPFPMPQGRRPDQPERRAPPLFTQENFDALKEGLGARAKGGGSSRRVAVGDACETLELLWKQMLREREEAQEYEARLEAYATQQAARADEFKEQSLRMAKHAAKAIDAQRRDVNSPHKKKRESRKAKAKKSSMLRVQTDACETLRLVATGGSGSTISECKIGGFTVVVKQYDLQTVTNKEHVSQVLHELEVVESLPSHPNIVQCMHYEMSPKMVKLFMPKYDCSLSALLSSKPDWRTGDNMVAVAHAVAKGLEVLHKRCVLHRDLKADNVLVSLGPDGSLLECAITDFDCAVLLDVEAAPEQCVGTPGYMAPEVLSSTENATPYGLPADVFAFAMLLFELLTGRKPYTECRNAFHISQAVMAGKLPEMSEEEAAVQPHLSQLFKCCAHPQWQERPNAGAVSRVLDMMTSTEQFLAPADVTDFLLTFTVAGGAGGYRSSSAASSAANSEDDSDD